MVTATTTRMGRQYMNAVDDLDVKTLGGLALVGPAGGVLASMGAERLLGLANRDSLATSPSSAQDYAIRGTTKLGLAAVTAMLARRFLGARNYTAAVVGLLALAGTIVAGADYYSAARQTRFLGNGNTSSAPRRSRSRSPGRSHSRSRSGPSRGSTRSSQTSIDAGTEDHRVWG